MESLRNLPLYSDQRTNRSQIGSQTDTLTATVTTLVEPERSLPLHYKDPADSGYTKQHYISVLCSAMTKSLRLCSSIESCCNHIPQADAHLLPPISTTVRPLLLAKLACLTPVGFQAAQTFKERVRAGTATLARSMAIASFLLDL
jgi:hypothetical protein